MNNWKTGTRIFLGFGATILLVVILGIFAYTELRVVNRAATRITADALPGISLLGDLQMNTAERFQLLEEYVNANVLNSMLGTDGSSEAKSEKARFETAIRETNSRNDALMADYEKTISLNSDRKLFEAIKTAQTPYSQSFTEVINLSLAGKHKVALDLIDGKLKQLRKTLGDAIKAEVMDSKTGGDEASRLARELRRESWYAWLFRLS